MGGTVAQALAYTREMRQITVGTHPDHRLPALDFQEIAIDIHKVVAAGLKDPGHPKLGPGLVHAPMACFRQALLRFAEKYEVG